MGACVCGWLDNQSVSRSTAWARDALAARDVGAATIQDRPIPQTAHTYLDEASLSLPLPLPLPPLLLLGLRDRAMFGFWPVDQ